MRLSTYLILVPAILIAAALAVANRGVVGLSFDPFSDSDPALVVQVPLFLLVYLTFFAGVLVGGIAAMLSRGKRRARGAEKKESRALIDPRDVSKPAS